MNFNVILIKFVLCSWFLVLFCIILMFWCFFFRVRYLMVIFIGRFLVFRVCFVSFLVLDKFVIFLLMLVKVFFRIFFYCLMLFILFVRRILLECWFYFVWLLVSFLRNRFFWRIWWEVFFCFLVFVEMV